MPEFERPDAVRCRAVKADGSRCNAIRARGEDFCRAHSEPGFMARIGAKGGWKTRAEREAGVDETLAASEAGRRKLLELTEHDDPRVAIAASRALYSIGPTKPPAEGSSGAEDVTAPLRHDPLRILSMLGEVGLVAPALVGDTVKPHTPLDIRRAVTQAVVSSPEVQATIAAFQTRVADAAPDRADGTTRTDTGGDDVDA